MMRSSSHLPRASRVLRRALPPGTLVVAVALGARPARADEPAAGPPPSETTKAAEAAQVGSGPLMALDPTAPQAAALPGGMTPAYGQKPLNPDEWRFDFHGFLTAPLNAGFSTRQNGGCPGCVGARPGQSYTTIHAPPVVPDDFETFSHTSVVPTTYAQLNFSESNGVVSANVSILARQANVSESFLEPASQAGVTDAFLSYLPDVGRQVRLRLLVGAFTSRYGATGEYDEGRYGTPLIARINGVGELVSGQYRLAPNWTLLLEQGLQGQTNTANASITPDVWNNFANPSEGTTFVNHFHAGVAYRSLAAVGVHAINAQSHDERVTGTLQPDGDITLLGADVRLTMGRYGHFYAALASTKASHAQTVSRIINVLNTPGGPGLGADYLGVAPSTGDISGTLTTAGGQYDLSIGRLMNFPRPFLPNGPDVFVSVFWMAAHVSSQTPLTGGMYGDGVTKLKLGAEATYSLLPWLAVSGRYDRVAPNIDNDGYTFAVVSPRVIFRTGWASTDQLVLQYSHWFNGGTTIVRTGSPPVDSPLIVPDSDMLSLAASMWW
jgi:hypothetical protein